MGEPSVPCPHIALSWPPDGSVTLEWIRRLTAILDWSSRNLPPSDLPTLLPSPVLLRILLAASDILHKEPNCVRVQADDDLSGVVVVGDVHGQLHDVLFLLEDAGFPGEDRLFVFNGDYVDRGAWGLETFVLLLAWKVFLPHRVFLLRGNHESKYCTSVYGFENEVMAKYGDQGKQVYRKCLRCFEGLPLASIIADCIYTAHGGLFRSMNITPSKRSKGKKGQKIVTNSNTSSLKLGSLEELSKARRTVLDPPWEGSNLIPGDVLWSDPSLGLGLSPNEERGIGLLWGPDCTEEFLKKNQFKCLEAFQEINIKLNKQWISLLWTRGSLLFGPPISKNIPAWSHEGPDARVKRHNLTGMDEGYTIDHDVESGKLITLFSAPDYPQFQASKERYNNRGAYIVLQPPDFSTPFFHTFEAIKPRPQVSAYYDYEEVIDSDEELDLKSMNNGSSTEGVASGQTD